VLPSDCPLSQVATPDVETVNRKHLEKISTCITSKDQQAFIDGKIVPPTMAKQARALASPS
jgi:hypothetical protein